MRDCGALVLGVLLVCAGAGAQSLSFSDGEDDMTVLTIVRRGVMA